MTAPADQLLSIGEVFTHPVIPKAPSFASLVCDSCGEMVVEGYARIVGDQKVCIPCQARLLEPQR